MRANRSYLHKYRRTLTWAKAPLTFESWKKGYKKIGFHIKNAGCTASQITLYEKKWVTLQFHCNFCCWEISSKWQSGSEQRIKACFSFWRKFDWSILFFIEVGNYLNRPSNRDVCLDCAELRGAGVQSWCRRAGRAPHCYLQAVLATFSRTEESVWLEGVRDVPLLGNNLGKQHAKLANAPQTQI